MAQQPPVPVSGSNEATALSALQNRLPLNWRTSINEIQSAAFSSSSSLIVVAAVPNYRIRAFVVKLIVSAAASVNWCDGAADGSGTNLEGAQSIVANGGYVEQVDPPVYLFQTSAGNALSLIISGGGIAAGRLSYWLAPGMETS